MSTIYRLICGVYTVIFGCNSINDYRYNKGFIRRKLTLAKLKVDGCFGESTMFTDLTLQVALVGQELWTIAKFTSSLGQFCQRSMCWFYVHKFRVQLFCANVLGLYFTGAKLLAQMLCVECW